MAAEIHVYLDGERLKAALAARQEADTTIKDATIVIHHGPAPEKSGGQGQGQGQSKPEVSLPIAIVDDPTDPEATQLPA